MTTDPVAARRPAQPVAVRLAAALVLAGAAAGAHAQDQAPAEPPADLLAGPSVQTQAPGTPTLVERNFDGTLVRLERFPELEALDRMALSPRTEAELERVLGERAAVIDAILQRDYRRLSVLTQELRTARENAQRPAGGDQMGMAPQTDRPADRPADRASDRRRGRAAAMTEDTRAKAEELGEILKPLSDRGTLSQEIHRVLSETERAEFDAMVTGYRDAARAERARDAGFERRGRTGAEPEGTGDPVLDFEDARPVRERPVPESGADGEQGPQRAGGRGAWATRLAETQGYVAEVMQAYRMTNEMRQEQNRLAIEELGLDPEQLAEFQAIVRSRDGGDPRETRTKMREFFMGLEPDQRDALRAYMAERRGAGARQRD